MSGQFSHGNEKADASLDERGSTTTVLLLVLLLAVSAAGYLYFFTDLIRPVKEEAKPVPAQTAQVKQPIPPRPAQQAGEGAAPAKPEGAKPTAVGAAPAAAPPQGGAAPPAKPGAGQKPVPAAAPPAKPEPAKVAKAEAPAKPAPPSAPAAKPASPAPAVKAASPAPAAKPAPPAAAAKAAPAQASPGKKEAAPVKTARKVEKPAVKRKGGAYALLIGDFVPDEKFETLPAKLKKSGITPVRMSAVTAAEPMNRLFVAEFTDQDVAEAELQKLKKLTADAFLIADNGRYSLYAGSYFTASRVSSEMRRLGAKGIKPVVKKAQATIKVTRVTAGSYGSAEEAGKDAQRLKKLGFSAKVIKSGK